MEEPKSFIYGEYEVYNLDDLINFDQAYFYGCLNRKRDVLRKRNITENDYFYAKITRDGWAESHENYSRVKILVKAEWVKSNVTKFLDIYGHSSKHPIMNTKSPQTSPISNNGALCHLKAELNKSMVLREAPPILELERHEKFQDDVYIYEVEVRGTREEDKIYFKGTDIQTLFEMENLVKNVKDVSAKQYVPIEDYEIFVVSKNTKRVKMTFITCKGLRKILRSSRSISPSILEMALQNPLLKQLNINMDVVYLYKEQEILGTIEQVFEEEEYVKQYSVEGYRIDMYFTEYKLALECDENNHKYRDAYYEEVRENKIKKKLKCTFIRFNPDDPSFKVSKLVQTITQFICEQKMQSLLLEKDKHIETLNKQIELFQEQKQEWTKEKQEWNKEKQEWNKEKQEWTNREQEWTKEKKKLLKVIDKLMKD